MVSIEGGLERSIGQAVLISPGSATLTEQTAPVDSSIERRRNLERIFEERREIIQAFETKIVSYPGQILEILGNLRESIKQQGAVGREAQQMVQSLEQALSVFGYSSNEQLLFEVHQRKRSGEVTPYPDEPTKLDKTFEQVSVIRDEEGTPFFEVISSTDSWLQVVATGESPQEVQENQRIADAVVEAYRVIKEYRSGGIRSTPKVIWREATPEELAQFEETAQSSLDAHDIAEFTHGKQTIKNSDPAAQTIAKSMGMASFLDTENGTLAGHGWAGSPDAFKRRAQKKLKGIEASKRAVYISGAFMGNDILREGRPYHSQETSIARKKALGLPLDMITINGYANSVEDELDELGWLGKKGMNCEEEGWSMGGDCAERVAANVSLRDIRFFALPPGETSPLEHQGMYISPNLLQQYGLEDIPSVDSVTQIRANFKVKSFTPAKKDACIFQVFPKVQLSRLERAHTIKSRILLTAGDLVFTTPLKHVPGVRRLAGGIVQWFARDLLPEQNQEVELSGQQHGEVCQKNWKTVQKQSNQLRNSDGISDQQLQVLSRGQVPVVRFVSTGDKLVHLEAVLLEIQNREKPAGFEPTTVLLDWGHNALATEEARTFPESAWMEITPLEWALYQDLIEQASRINAGMQLTETEQLIISHYNTMATLTRLLDFQINSLPNTNPQSEKLRSLLVEEITREFEASIQGEPKADMLR